MGSVATRFASFEEREHAHTRTYNNGRLFKTAESLQVCECGHTGMGRDKIQNGQIAGPETSPTHDRGLAFQTLACQVPQHCHQSKPQWSPTNISCTEVVPRPDTVNQAISHTWSAYRQSTKNFLPCWIAVNGSHWRHRSLSALPLSDPSSIK
jgi:hypothetical protein